MTVRVTQVTDPLCTWCWGSEPVLRRLDVELGHVVEFEYVLGGLVEDFDDFVDPANGIEAPADVAPHWEEAARRHGMPVDPDLWTESPPHSTYPASIAVKAAEMQDTDRAHAYLRRIREAAATERRNVAERAVLLELAGDVGLDATALTTAIESGAAVEAFESDRQFVRDHGAGAFPTYRVASDDADRWLSGFRSFDDLARAVESLAPDVDRRDPPDVPGFVAEYGYVATREVAEVYGWSDGKAEQVLDELEADGRVASVERAAGRFWAPPDSDRVARQSGLACRVDGRGC